MNIISTLARFIKKKKKRKLKKKKEKVYLTFDINLFAFLVS